MKIMHSDVIPDPKLPRDYLGLPIVLQSSDFSCGSAVMQSLLHYWKAYDGGDDEIKQLLNTSCETGTQHLALFFKGNTGLTRGPQLIRME